MSEFFDATEMHREREDLAREHATAQAERHPVSVFASLAALFVICFVMWILYSFRGAK